jgi:hypothetical protein
MKPAILFKANADSHFIPVLFNKPKVPDGQGPKPLTGVPDYSRLKPGLAGAAPPGPRLE